jgi:HSP90 family molecular chaperone
LGEKPKNENDKNGPHIPEDDITTFCLWLKENHKTHVGKVTISKRLTDVPLVLFGQVSAQMRIMAQMM